MGDRNSRFLSDPELGQYVTQKKTHFAVTVDGNLLKSSNRLSYD